MSRVRKAGQGDNIIHTSGRKGGGCPQIPAFSFAHITSNRTYTLDYFKDANDRRVAALHIHNRLLAICQKDWRYWHQQPKESGTEVIRYERINFSPSNKTLLSDEKIIIFRLKGYANNSARILGVKDEGCPILYIIGYDFDFSAYKHE